MSVPYAVMAYRAMPHCSTKYPPYYLVFCREMRLPIEDVWKPRLVDDRVKESGYEEHVRTLANDYGKLIRRRTNLRRVMRPLSDTMTVKPN
jgi:hypothetical protein